MNNRNYVLLLFLTLMVGIFGSALSMQGGAEQLTGVRDKGEEDQVAKLFESIRTDAKLPALTRIRHRASLQQQVCTVSYAGSLGNRLSGLRAAFYRTAHPESVSAELARVASFKDPSTKGDLAYPRYSVSVWVVKNSVTGEATYSVGVELYSSALEEFVDSTFTDGALYYDGWKKGITPACRHK